jgi:transposase
MGDGRAAAAQTTTTQAISRAKADLGSTGANRDTICAEVWHSLENAAAGNGLWLGDELLATTEGLAASPGLGPTAPSVALETARGRTYRFCTSGGRQLLRARRGRGEKTGPNPTDRRRAGSKHHLLTDAQGIPLSVILTEANRHDVTQLIPLLEAIPPVAGQCGAPKRKPALIQADRGYDSDPLRALLAERGIGAEIARRYTSHGSSLGKTRWIVERTIAWLHQFRRLRIRFERLAQIHEAFLKLGCALICWRFLKAT